MEESGAVQTKVDDGCGRGLLGKLLQFLENFFTNEIGERLHFE